MRDLISNLRPLIECAVGAYVSSTWVTDSDTYAAAIKWVLS
jgi:hypothetical protein